MTIPAIHPWPSNGHLLADVATLHLQDTNLIFDATYGLGTWWTQWTPPILITNDLNPKTDARYNYDFCSLPFPDRVFDCVAYDPPFKLSGTNSLTEFDARYGLVDMDWRARLTWIIAGAIECARVTRNTLLIKCQDQVCSGQMRWQTIDITNAVTSLRFRLVDQFTMIGPSMPQPHTSQKHARNRGSSLLVFRRT